MVQASSSSLLATMLADVTEAVDLLAEAVVREERFGDATQTFVPTAHVRKALHILSKYKPQLKE